jgi:gliding motility-associated-like protein
VYQWDFGGNGFSNDFELEILFPFQLEGYTIQLVASTAEGCHDTAVAHLMVEDQILVYVPNTFTPDGDEYNNDFFPVISSEIDPTDYLLSIFNRWGQIIFQSKNIEEGWDGTFDGQFVQDGTYVWKVEFKYKARGYEETGHVNIFR